MTIETEIASLTTATLNLTSAVATQQQDVNNKVFDFAATTARVNALSNVQNTTDLNKPTSFLTQTALNNKQNTLIDNINISTVNGVSLLSGTPLVIVRSATSLNMINYDNRGTLRTTTSQIDDSTIVEGLGLFMWINNKLEPDDDETCFNTLTGQWLLQVPSWDLIDAWNSIEQSIADDYVEDTNAKLLTLMTINNQG